ncbi:MAG: polysaccharide biosynthesis protein [Mucilaginibacter sp.]|uniref:oligosaccharide flippase family protein n=1 Tax=Mucilaginibacter sp. TaxID=1882438 RepID=UPI002637F2AF|nr:oligosaccharide flippase family protein [Mucilaginibacter sp.]MDB5002615.1 polysaccharide biosynthesis protein [Mucilaginibacter sp.]
MSSNNLKNLSANALQLVANQVFGLVIFYILSTTLSKDGFGQINLALAILLSAFNILSCGIDQLIIKKIAAGDDKQSALSLYITHTLFTGLVFYGILVAVLFVFPHPPTIYNLLLLIGIGKLMTYLSTPYKQAASGLELFKLLAWLSIISNFVRCILLVVFLFLHRLDLYTIVAIFIIGDTLEFVLGVPLFKKWAKIPIAIKWDKTNYVNLVREALPQIGVVLITSSLARFDWIFIGFILSAAKLAEYSFAYKLFEIATLPLLAIAPLLIPRFTKMFKQDEVNTDGLKFLIRMEMILAAFTVLLLNVYWAPVIDWLTHNKYGTVNINTIFILSLCLPLLYIENFFWTIFFAQGRLKMILNAFMVTLAVNIAGDIVLIPIYKNEGAAIAFLLACIAQIVFYLNKNTLPELKKTGQPLIICTICALCSGFATKAIFADNWLVIPTAILGYLALLIITGQLQLKDRQRLKAIIG